MFFIVNINPNVCGTFYEWITDLINHIGQVLRFQNKLRKNNGRHKKNLLVGSVKNANWKLRFMRNLINYSCTACDYWVSASVAFWVIVVCTTVLKLGIKLELCLIYCHSFSMFIWLLFGDSIIHFFTHENNFIFNSGINWQLRLLRVLIKLWVFCTCITVEEITLLMPISSFLLELYLECFFFFLSKQCYAWRG